MGYEVIRQEEKINEYLSNPEIQKLLDDEIAKNESYESWANMPYECNPIYPEYKNVPSVGNLMVRSKTESTIAIVLTNYGIPFRYECKLEIGDKILYPDFTAINIRTGEMIYWEHHGLIESMDYVEKKRRDMLEYLSYQIIPGQNLIVTCETKDYPLPYETICSCVELYLL